MIEVPRGTKPSTARMATILHELQWRTAVTKERQRGHWIPVPSGEWRTLIGSRYRSELDKAEQLGYVETNRHYSKGRFPKSYRLADAYRTPETDILPNRAPRSQIRLRDDDRVAHLLVGRFSTVELPSSVQCAGWDGYHARQIRQGAYYATRCQYGRFHSTFTGLRRDVRHSLLDRAGRSIVETDVANCQPLIVGMLALAQSSHKHTSTPPTNHIPYVAQTADLRSYVDLCERGEVYEFLLEQCKDYTLRDMIPPDKWHGYAADRPLQRSDIKRQFVTLLFAPNQLADRLLLMQMVDAHWPTLAQFVRSAKRDCYQALARECQSFESRLMIGGVAARVLTNHTGGDLAFITVHDAIATTPDQVDIVEDCVRAEFQAHGLKPTLKRTYGMRPS